MHNNTVAKSYEKATGFWQVVVSMYNIADFKFRSVATQYKSSSTTETGSRVRSKGWVIIIQPLHDVMLRLIEYL